jgi:hypothetical protein
MEDLEHLRDGTTGASCLFTLLEQCHRPQNDMYDPLVACRSEVVTDEGAFHKFISIAALHTATEHLACPLTLSLRQATSVCLYLYLD